MSVCIVVSLIYIKHIKNHTKAVRQCALMIENIKILIEYKNLNVSEIFNVICNSVNYSQLTFLSAIKSGICDYQNTVNEVFQNRDDLLIFDTEDLEYLKGFLSMLGRSDTYGQVTNCNLYKKLFEKKCAELESSEKTRCKCAATVIVGIGLLFSIILI